MSCLESNVFPVANLKNLKSRYRVYRIRGLPIDHDEYDLNVQALIQGLSYKLVTPVTVVKKDGNPYLVMKDGAPEPPSPFNLVRATVYFDKTDEVMTLDYEHLTSETVEIGKRFMQSAINMALRKRFDMWSPATGKPVFSRHPLLTKNGVDVFRGFSVRVVVTKDGYIAVCVDVKHRYVSHTPVQAVVSKEAFRASNLKGMHFVYHFGNDWYEIQIEENAGLSIEELKIEIEPRKFVSLLEYIHDRASKPLPKEVTILDPKGTALQYYNTRNMLCSVPAALCYPVFDTNDPRVRKLHQEAILVPERRRALIHEFVKSYLKSIRFDESSIEVSEKPLEVDKRRFPVPDLCFGNKTVLSERHTQGSVQVELSELGQTRLNSLFSSNRGPFGVHSLAKQYLIWPRSVEESYGKAFLADLTSTMKKLLPGEDYKPIVIPYNDLGKKDFATQERAILDAVGSMQREPGFGVVMIHETADRKKRERDKLAAMVMRELRKLGLYVAVIHPTMAHQSYVLVTPQGGAPSYQVTTDYSQMRRFEGYLRNVAITKILLTNEIWPFVLGSPLHADMTIGIDVQLNTACFTFVGRSGGDTRIEVTDSNQKELLGRKVVQTTVLKVLRQEVHEFGRSPVRTLVVHRDGRLFPDEIKGLLNAFEILKRETVATPDATITLVEIQKTAPAPVRLFDVTRLNGREQVINPQVGSSWVMSGTEAYLLTTGRAFKHPGTCNPLHVRLIKAGMPFESVLEDMYALSCLAWTRPEDCSRVPVTIKLADIRLRENAGGYDEDALEFIDETEEDEENE